MCFRLTGLVSPRKPLCLCTVRADRIVVSGASRSGPLAVITAARRPRNICGVSAFVHTSAGISWTDKPYLPWGLPGGHNPADADQVKRLAAMAA